MNLLSARFVRALSLIAMLVALGPAVFAQGAPRAETGASGGDNTLAAFWPFGMAPRTWTLVNRHGRPAMQVTYASPTPDSLDLIFIHEARQTLNGGGFNAGRQRFCANAGNPFLFLDGYAAVNADGTIRQQHPVTSTRLILTPQGGRPVDLIADGTYARCGNAGQPYLRWDLDIQHYRLQAWGYLTGHPQQRWYWDALVDGPVTLSNDPCHLQKQLTAMKVQEAWWSDFRRGEGHWIWGNGAIGPDASPSGANITYGRTDWHAKGHMPWYMVTSDRSFMCTRSVQDGTSLPVQQLLRTRP